MRCLPLLCLLLAACGGSASETPFPQSPDEVSVYPTPKKPVRPPPRASGTKPPAPPPEE